MKIYFYTAGNKKLISLNKEKSDSLFTNLKNLIEGIDDEARLVVDEERLDELKQNDHLIEIIFKENKSFSSNEFKNYEIQKILIPITGDLSVTENDDGVIIFLGSGNYDSSPYLNTNGKTVLKNIVSILLN